MPTDLNRTVRVVNSSEPKTHGERKPFSDYLTVPNIILLGDPGAGKTHTFKAAARKEDVDCSTVRRFLACGGNTGKKIIYLDGLDEYRSRSDNKNLIIELIKLLNQQEHYKIRLSCRSADWLGDIDLILLKDFFGQSPYVVLSLEPFTEEELVIILSEKGVSDPADFIARAKSLNMVNLLGNPQTLIMLVDVVLNGSWPDARKELFEESCSILLEEVNREHTGSGQGTFGSDELIESAGIVAATLLISGAAGVSLLEGGLATAEFPSYKTVGFEPKEKIQACLMRRCFSYIDDQDEALTYIHRTVAEFLGARWLAEKIRAGHPLSRILSIIGKDGYPATELRGLHAWLPVFLPEFAEVFIKNDPYGVLMYGDAASLTLAYRKILLSNLVQLSKTDPWFRESEWSDTQLGALSGVDMVDLFRGILSNHASSFHLRSLVLGAIAHGPALLQMREPLMAFVASGKIYHEAAIAVEALLKVVPDGKQGIIDVFHSTLKKKSKTARLRGKILCRLYENNFQPRDVLSVCSDVLHDTEQHAIGELWDMAATLPETALPEILDTLCALNTGEDFNGERTNQHIVESVFERLLHRLLQTDFMPQPERLWQWLTTLFTLGSRYVGGGNDDIGSWLKKNPSLVFEMLLLAFEKVEEQKRWLFWSDFEKITMRSLAGEELIRRIFKELVGKSNISEADHALYEKCGSQIFWSKSEIILELLDIFQSLADQHHSFRSTCVACCQCKIEDWRLRDIERSLKHREKKEKQRAKNQHNLAQTRDSIEAGEQLHNLGFLAKIYFCEFSYVDRSLPPVDRLRETIGQEYVDLALSGFVAILDRDDLPTPYDIALSLSENTYCPWWYAVMAGINEVWLRQEKTLAGFSDNLLKSALAIATEFPANSEGDKDREWLQQLLDERPDIVEFVYEEIARTELQHTKSHISVLYSLQFNEETKGWRSRTALKLLKQFTCCSPNDLRSLVVAVFYDPKYRDALKELAKHSVLSCHGEQREMWLVIGFLLNPAKFGALLNGYSKRHGQVVWKLRDLSQRAVIKETDKSLQLSIEQIEYCALITGRAFAKISRPDSVTMGDQNPWDGAEFVHENINKLAAIPDSESTEALKRLLAEACLSSYHDHIRHSLANQAVVRREAEYLQPSWVETVESLKGGKPANIADLHALVLDQLQTIKDKIKHGNTDPYKAFWRCDSYGNVDTPEIEDVCRDRLIDLLEPSLTPLDLYLEPEGHMAAEKRSDIIILGPGKMKLPIELKRDFHQDVWTACTTQLERMYSHDPGAKGYGIYGVFWFGDRRTSNMKNPPDRIAMPQSAEELEDALQSLVLSEQQETIKVAVFDVTPPFEG